MACAAAVASASVGRGPARIGRQALAAQPTLSALPAALGITGRPLPSSTLSTTLSSIGSAAAISSSARLFADASPSDAGRGLTATSDRLDDIGRRRIFGPEEDAFRESVRRFMRDEVAPQHDTWEEAGQVPLSMWERAGELGLLGVQTPEADGGPGGTAYHAAIINEEQIYAGASGFGLTVHSDIVLPYIVNYGSEEQKKRYVGPMLAGTTVGAIAMTEPGTGSDLQGIQTVAKEDGNGNLILNGSKTFITNGQNAGVVIVVAKTDPTAGARGMSLLLVDDGMQGFTKGRNLKKMGLRAQDTSELFFEDVVVPPSHVLGRVGAGFAYLMSELPQERLMIGVVAVAACEAMFEMTREYAKERHAFGKPIISKQVIAHKLAEIKSDVCVARSFVDDCIEQHARGTLDATTAAMVKSWTTDLQVKVADRCVQIFGGWGYMWEYPICRAFVDSRVQPIYGGTNEIMKELIGRSL